MSHIKLQPNHTLTSWLANGINILFPEQDTPGGKHGGLPVCAPMFSMQQRPVAGCDLPLHGILLYLDTGVITEIESGKTVTTKHLASECFAWDFTATSEVRLAENTLTHILSITRSSTCQNPNEMPLSLGLHPYFSTFGSDFLLQVGDTNWTKSTIPADINESYFASFTEGQSAMLTTKHSTITITPNGFDEYCLWSDNIEAYMCIEPIYQYREFGLPGTGLQPGEKKEVSCTISFTPSRQ